MHAKILNFIGQKQPETPCLIVDVDLIAQSYQKIHHALSCGEIYYAVKANPAPAILKRLVNLSSSFDAASWEEILLCLQAGAEPSTISFGNTIKKVSAIQKAYQAGIELYAFDSLEELEKIACHAPHSKVYCRLIVDNMGADWPLSGKFGTTIEHATELLIHAKKLELIPYGVSFHVGSQQTDPQAYGIAIDKAAYIFQELKHHNIHLQMMNLGGGFPIQYRNNIPDIEHFVEIIHTTLTRHFDDHFPRILLEPGRFIVGQAGIISTEIILSSQRGKTDGPRWIYLDIGRFGGLAETEGEAIQYPIKTPYDGSPTGMVILAGPSCDGVDVLYQKSHYALPLNLKSGDKIFLLNTGAYVSTYCSTSFNGFAPLTEYYI